MEVLRCIGENDQFQLMWYNDETSSATKTKCVYYVAIIVDNELGDKVIGWKESEKNYSIKICVRRRDIEFVSIYTPQ